MRTNEKRSAEKGARSVSGLVSMQQKQTTIASRDAVGKQADGPANHTMHMPVSGFAQRKCTHCEGEKQLRKKPVIPFIQRQENKETKKEEKKDPLKEGFSKLGEELLKNPKVKPYTQQLKLHLWDNQPDEFKYSIVGFGITDLAIISSVFALDPVFRKQTISFLDNKDLFTPFSLIPKSEYFILKSAKYKLPKKDEKEIEFDGEFDLSPYFKLFHNPYLADIKPSFGLNFKYTTDTGHLNVNGGAFNIKFYHEAFSLSGAFNQPMLKLPQTTLGPSPFDAGFRSLPDGPSANKSSLPNDIHFVISVDLMKLIHHGDDKKTKPEPESLQRKPTIPDVSYIQRKCAERGSERNGSDQQRLQAPFIQKKVDCDTASVNGHIAAQINRTIGDGQAMESPTRRFMESRFGANFSDVHIHTDLASERLSNELNAQAFTYGRDIYFDSGKYKPDTAEGGHLLAHELTHVMQQSGGLPGHSN